MNAKQYFVPSRSLQFESRVLSLFQVVRSCSRKGRSAGRVLQSAQLRLLFLAALVTESVNLYILKISILLVENCWSKLYFAQLRTPSPSFKQQSFFKYQIIQMVHHRFLNTVNRLDWLYPYPEQLWCPDISWNSHLKSVLALLDTHKKPSCLKRGFTTSWTPLKKMHKREEGKLCSLKRSDTQLQPEGKHLLPSARHHFLGTWCCWDQSGSYWSHTGAQSHSPWPNDSSRA